MTLPEQTRAPVIPAETGTPGDRWRHAQRAPGHGPLGTKADVTRTADYLETSMRAALHSHAMDDFSRRATFLNAKKQLASVFFDVEDLLRPKYGVLGGFDQLILPTTQWCLFAILTGA